MCAAATESSSALPPQTLSDPCPPPVVQPRQTLHRSAVGLYVLVVRVVVVVSVRVRVRVVVSFVLVFVPLRLLAVFVLPVLLFDQPWLEQFRLLATLPGHGCARML